MKVDGYGPRYPKRVMFIMAAAVLVMLAAASLLSGCRKESRFVDPCQVHPTRTASDGSWVEHDGEALDDDPCDADDLDDDGLRRKPRPTKTPKGSNRR